MLVRTPPMSEEYIPNVEIGQTVQYFRQGNLKEKPVAATVVDIQSPGVVELRWLPRAGYMPLVSAVMFWKHPEVKKLTREHISARGLWRFVPKTTPAPEPEKPKPKTTG